jgi:hypothetical protein
MLLHTRFRLSKLSLGLAAVLAAAPVFAQSTSAGVGGLVSGADGQPVTGAEVTITHVESGTVSRAVTDASGRYNARGLRVGGPYTITVTKEGAGTDTEENIYLGLNQVNTVDAALQNDVTTLATVQAIAAAPGSDIFSANKMGTGTNVSRQTIEALPSANRNIQDYIRLDPRISQVSKADGAISVGGQNTRFNNIRIDGVGASDPFGLESNNLPTERQPVSMDAIEAINIDVANYDTAIGGATGAVIDAVTKSGTNEFHGSVYYAYRDKDWVREDLRGVEFNGWNDEKTYGATLGGPIIKDKLFFFANYEKYVRSAPGTSLSGTPYGEGSVTDDDIRLVQEIAQSRYGFDAGTLSLPSSSETESEEKAVKIDWNITDSHRASLRYNEYEQSVLRFPLISTTGQVSLSSSWYALPKTYKTWVGQLFSDWSDDFSTELKIARKEYDAVRSPFSNLPQIEIEGFGDGGGDSLYLGTEQNTHVNIIGTKEDSIFAAATWYAGDHTIKGGVDYTKSDILNFYGRNLNGVYVFDCIQAVDCDASFESGTPSNYQVRGPRPDGGSYDDIPAKYTIKNTALFLQDTWAATYNLNLMFGVRVDIPEFSDQRLYNPLIEETYEYDNTNTVDDKLVQPRFGFNYSFNTERPTQLRGGVGLFGGTPPNVWLAGTYQNTGLNYVEYTVTDPAQLQGIFTPNVDPPYIPAGGGSSGARANVDIAEPGLKLPSSWKANLALDHELPWYGIVASAEFLMTRVKDGLYFERLDLYDGEGNGPTAFGQDGRPIFWNAAGLDPDNAGNFGITAGTNGARVKNYRPDGIGDVMLMRNTDKGSSSQFTMSLNKPLVENWGWSLAYTRTNAKEVSPLTSSQNTSNWSNTLIGTANENVAYNSRYAIKDRVTGSLTWQKALFGDNKTTIGLFYEGRSGRPYSYIYYNDVNGDGANTNDLFYVPEGPGDVLFSGNADMTPEQMEAAFFAWLEDHPELNAYRGSIAPANRFNAGWINNFDLHISQELPGFMDGHHAELSFDVMNIGNLLNKDWGVIEDYGFFSTARVANYAGIDPVTGKYVYNFSGTTDRPGIQENNNDKGNTGVSRWSVMATFRYKF